MTTLYTPFDINDQVLWNENALPLGYEDRKTEYGPGPFIVKGMRPAPMDCNCTSFATTGVHDAPCLSQQHPTKRRYWITIDTLQGPAEFLADYFQRTT